MDAFDVNLPHDIDACHELIIELDRERRRQAAVIAQQQETIAQQQETIAQQQAIIAQQQETIDRLQSDVDLLKRTLYGRRRERFVDDSQQGLLFDSTIVGADDDSGSGDDESDDDEPSPERRTSKGRGRRLFPELLPRKTVRHELDEHEAPEELRSDPAARRFFKKTSEQLEFTPASIHVIEHYQEVIVRDEASGETTIVSATKPPQLIDAYAGPGFWAHLTASRFADHLPYYRQEDILARHGCRIGRGTQQRWLFALALAVAPLVELMRRLALQSEVLGCDETPVKMLAGEPPGCTKTYLWSTVGDNAHPYDCFHFTPDRSRDGPDEFLAGFQGYLQSDAYTCYERIAAAEDRIVPVGCWAHARRKFEEIHFSAPSVRTHTALGYFQRLYDIEDRARDSSVSQRGALRQRDAKPIVTEFHQWLLEQSERELPKSKWRAAIAYMTNRWQSFACYLDHGAIPIDNNRTEAALKYAVLGRKAWLFFGNSQGGETAATFFTLTKSCNRHHVDPFAYLRDVYTRLPTTPASDLPSLLPDRWIDEHPQHRLQERADEARQRADRKRARRAQRRAPAATPR
ncbi:Transposase IS66 family protein [Planctomycetes bacterium Pan216]|uniref:Transposase IS66 family protein n=1 Tax=Kolteria novifilia TaxID=2527975 RepID=A0A518B7G4_9BACT|nr:Transposase IS66 family protein [Planctomycetes bacterium Pan216]